MTIDSGYYGLIRCGGLLRGIPPHWSGMSFLFSCIHNQFKKKSLTNRLTLLFKNEKNNQTESLSAFSGDGIVYVVADNDDRPK